MSTFWSGWIIALTVVNIAGALWLLWATSRKSPGESTAGTTGHTWDGDLQEYNNPLPRWWLWLFYGTVVFSVLYLVLYPGFGSFQGTLGWSQEGQYQQEVDQAEARFGEFYARFADMDLHALAGDDQAMSAAGNIFGNRCAQCHGADGGGAPGFPALTDQAWLWGSDPQAVLTSIGQGRNGVMPPMGEAIGGAAGVARMVEYVRSLSGLEHDAALAAEAKPLFAACGACHGMDGKGNPVLGAPDLTDGNWLWGSDRTIITATIENGRQNQMPPQRAALGDTRVKLMAAYVLRLSGQSGGTLR